MADNQMVKIVFDFDLGNVPASAKKLSQYLKDNSLDLKFTKASVDGLSASLGQLATQQTKAGATAAAAGNSVKKSNQQWMSLSLVVQDLPYGFRGIQNNLPALVGSFAAAGGAIYFVFSALIAITTSYEKEIKALFITTTEAEKQQQLYNNVVKESGTAYVDAQTQVLSLTQKVKLAKDGYIDKQSVINEYNETIGKTIGKQKDLEGVNQALINQGPAYVEYINKLSFAMAAAKLVAEQSEKMIKISMQNATEFVDGWDAFFKAKWNPSGIVQSLAGGTVELQKSAEKNRQIQLGEAGKTAVGYEKIMKDAFKAAGIAAKKAGVVPALDPNKPVLKQDKTLLNSLKSEQQLYKDDLFMKRAIGLEVLKEEKRLAVEEAKFNKVSKEALLNIDKDFEFKRLLIEKEAIEEIQKIRIADKDKLAKDTEQANKEAENEAKKVNDRNLQNALTALKIESDVAMKIANASGKTTATDRIKILENYKSKLYELASTGGYTADQFDKISDALVNVDAAIAGSQDKVKSFNITWVDTINNINSVIMDFINSSMAALGESIGKALAGENIDVINVFGTLLADALTQIGKQLIALATASLFAWALLKSNNPITAAAALVAGIAAVAAGSFMKSSLEQDRAPKKFANGGIISGPTMGLMGEYPGAKTNPEVVAPLDKLKSMMGSGSGSGEFVLRGNDLILAIQRSNSSLKLRRG